MANENIRRERDDVPQVQVRFRGDGDQNGNLQVGQGQLRRRATDHNTGKTPDKMREELPGAVKRIALEVVQARNAVKAQRRANRMIPDNLVGAEVRFRGDPSAPAAAVDGEFYRTLGTERAGNAIDECDFRRAVMEKSLEVADDLGAVLDSIVGEDPDQK